MTSKCEQLGHLKFSVINIVRESSKLLLNCQITLQNVNHDPHIDN